MCAVSFVMWRAVKSFQNFIFWLGIQTKVLFTHRYLNYYLSGAVCPSICLSECLSAKIFFLSKMDQIRKFGEQTSRILEFKTEGLEGYLI